jgi:hypothetical protein
LVPSEAAGSVVTGGGVGEGIGVVAVVVNRLEYDVVVVVGGGGAGDLLG